MVLVPLSQAASVSPPPSLFSKSPNFSSREVSDQLARINEKLDEVLSAVSNLEGNFSTLAETMEQDSDLEED